MIKNIYDLRDLLSSKKQILVSSIMFKPFRKAFDAFTNAMFFAYGTGAYDFEAEDFAASNFAIHWEDTGEEVLMIPEYIGRNKEVNNFIEDWLDENYYLEGSYRDFDFSLAAEWDDDISIVFNTEIIHGMKVLMCLILMMRICFWRM